MTLYRFTFPIPNYEDNDTLEKHIYFEAEKCPTQAEVISALQKAHAEEVDVLKKFAERDGVDDYMLYYQGGEPEYLRCLEAIDQAEDCLPLLYGSLIHSNVFCETKHGRKALSVEVIKPIKV